MANKSDNEKKKPSEREKKYQKKLAQEKKKLNSIISFPSKALFGVSLIAGLMTFTYSYFGSGSELISALLTSFFAFSVSFIGVGFTMILYFFLKSEQIKKEFAQQVLMEKNERLYEEQRRYNKEMTELESIEKELFANKSKPKDISNGKSSGAKLQMSDEEAYLEEVLNSNFKK